MNDDFDLPFLPTVFVIFLALIVVAAFVDSTDSGYLERCADAPPDFVAVDLE